MSNKPQRPECVGCMFEGKSTRCAWLELEWALYNLKKELPFLRRIAKEPDPCELREVKEDMQ